MPDGFEPHTELARIFTLKELMAECRQRTPTILKIADDILADPDSETYDKIQVMKMLWDRGYGKPRQTIAVSETTEDTKRVQVYIPDNGRANISIKTIDVEPEKC